MKILNLIFLSVIFCITSFAQKEIKLNKQEHQKLCVFFSNFAEVKLKPFKRGEVLQSELIRFGIGHIFQNNPKLIERIGKTIEGKINKKYVESAIKKYFGIENIDHQSVYDTAWSAKYEFKNDFYIIPYAYDIRDEVEHNFAYVKKIYDLGNNEYKVNGEDIMMSYEFDPAYKYISAEEIKKKTDNIETAPFTAIISKVKENNKERYILIKYLGSGD